MEPVQPSLKFAHRLESAGFMATQFVFERLSLSVGPPLAATIARPFSPLVRKRAFKNLCLAMPDLTKQTQRRIITGMVDNLVRTSIEYTKLSELRDDPNQITIHNSEHLHTARAAGKGAVLISGHIGNWEMVRAACARLDWPPAIIYRRFNNPYFDAEARRYMRALDAPIFHKGKRGTLGLLRHIKKGGVAMILSDQRFSGAPYIPFFDVPARTSLAPAELAREYGAAFLPVRGIRRGRSSAFDVTFDAPLTIGEGTDGAYAAMQEVNARLESWIRETPDQYFWLHNRWGAHPINTLRSPHPESAPPRPAGQ